MSENKTPPTQQIITSETEWRKTHPSMWSNLSKRGGKHKRTVFIIVGLIVLLGAAGSYLMWPEDKVAPPAIVDISGVRDYFEMSKPQIDYSLYKKTGLTIEYLQKKGVSKGRLNSFDKAYEVAQALYYYGDKKLALDAYAIAQDKKPQNDDYTFYLDYAAAALRANDKTTWKQEMLLARAVVAKRPHQPEPTEDMTPEKIDHTIKLVESN
jgi:hypothetical protein